MKPARFDYAAPSSVSEVLALLDEDSRPLAGGQSLVPMLNFRLARPTRLVDLERVAGLDHLQVDGDVLRIGAMTRQAAVERSPVVGERWPLLRQALRLVGHPQIRSRGTVGGSVAHADPKAELPVALTVLGARFHVRSTTGTRTLVAVELFRGPLMTALEPDELLVEIEVPAPPAGARRARAHAR
jgi:CO/xanthine dehydrogenase FAD-binding subunit